MRFTHLEDIATKKTLGFSQFQVTWRSDASLGSSKASARNTGEVANTGLHGHMGGSRRHAREKMIESSETRHIRIETSKTPWPNMHMASLVIA
jgi:hypothetical protein